MYLAGAGIRLGQPRETFFWRKWSRDESAVAKLEGRWQPVVWIYLRARTLFEDAAGMAGS